MDIVDEACIKCGLCLPACPHDAIAVTGQIGRALAVAARGDGVLILCPEAAAHFFPATPEQVVNACYQAGYRTVSRGVVGDELVAAEYLRLWRQEEWGTMIRSTDPAVVEAIRSRYPELVPYLAPVATPAEAEARYLRARHGPEARVVYAGVNPPADVERAGLEAAITFHDLELIFRLRGVSVLTQPDYFLRVPEERRRHLSAAGGLPLAFVAGGSPEPHRFQKIRGLAELSRLSHAVVDDRLEMGFVDLLSFEGALDNPLSGPPEELYRRRRLVASTEPPRSPSPVVDAGLLAGVGATFDLTDRPPEPDASQVAIILEAVGTGPNGRPWDCGACGFDTCRQFAEAAALGRATLRQCAPYQERRAREASEEAASDSLTGLSTVRVLRDRLGYEVERSKRSNESFAVLFIDLDKFKEVNDTHGHEAGNKVLRAVAEEIRGAVRASDLAARYGGDEFVVILTRTDLSGAGRVAEVIRAGIEGVGRRLGFGVGQVTASIGLAEFDPADPEGGDLLETADRALYEAKSNGRNAVARGAQALDRTSTENDLEASLN